MKLHSWSVAALAACALLACGGSLQAKQTGGSARTADEIDYEDLSQHELATYNSARSGSSCSTCSTGGGGLAGLMDRPIQLIFGAEYIYAKANFSDALSYVEQDLIAGGETWHCFDFDYNSSYSFYGGVYLPDCGGAVIFDFTRLTSDARTAANSTSTVNIFGPFEIDDNIEGFADVDLRTYDLSFAKTIPLGCPLECSGGKGCGDCCDDACCSSCGDGCGCGWCPAWDITWSAGVRFADVSWARGLTAFDPLNNNAVIDSYTTRMNFNNGFGGRVGLMGRRYFGRRGLASLYARGDWSLLVGDVEIETLVTNQAGTAFHRRHCQQVIPVTEIELGGSIHLGQHATLSSGYFWAAWHDLGMSETYDFNPNFQMSHYDDANILGFHGLFARVEVAF
ncbi:MAG TPA: hypothetical protein PKC18_09765 [Lacipirellulaceae bacterium]|nr:hypothetical protein [Lacipirellulaceae bacterium]